MFLRLLGNKSGSCRPHKCSSKKSTKTAKRSFGTYYYGGSCRVWTMQCSFFQIEFISGRTSTFISAMTGPFPRIEERKLALVRVYREGRKHSINMIKGGWQRLVKIDITLKTNIKISSMKYIDRYKNFNLDSIWNIPSHPIDPATW